MGARAIFNAANRARRAPHCPSVARPRLAENSSPDNRVLTSPAPMKSSRRCSARRKSLTGCNTAGPMRCSMSRLLGTSAKRRTW
eukprot:7351193-Pyramimonas_sp.AAC.1